MAVKNVTQARFLLRNGLASDWKIKNPVLLKGELGVEIDTGLLKLGDGVSTFNELRYINVTPIQLEERIASAGLLKREIVEVLPQPQDADPNTIYMIKDTTSVGPDYYKEYMLIDGILTQIGDTSVDLSGVLRIPENYVEGDLAAFDANGQLIDFDISHIHTSTNVKDLIQDEGNELVLYCGSSTEVI